MTRLSVVALLLVGTTGLLGSGPASARPTEMPPPASVTQVVPPAPTEDPLLTADPEDAADTVPPEPAPSAPPGTAPSPAPDARGGVQSGQADDAEVRRVLEEIAQDREEPVPDLITALLEGTHESPRWDSYELGASVGLTDRLMSHWARIQFEIGKVAVLFAGWVGDLVLRFDLGRAIAGAVGPLSGHYADLLRRDEPPLRELVLLIAVAHAGWQILRHRRHAAVAELLVAAAIAVTGGFMLEHADAAACGGLAVMGELTLGTLALADISADPPDDPDGAPWRTAEEWCAAEPVPSEALAPMDRLITSTFVHEPYLLLQWGVVPPVGDDCRRVSDAIVEGRPWGDDDQPRVWMRAAGCESMAAFNETMTSARVAGAGAYALSAMAFAVAVVLTAGTLLVAQVAGALLVLAMPVAVVIGIAPGAGRELLARWGHGVLKVAVLFMGSGFFLAFMVSSISVVQTATPQRGVFVRMLASTVVAWSMVVLRGRIMGGMRLLAHGVARSAAGGRHAGPVGTGPAQVAVNRAFQAADLAATMHAGAVAGMAAVRTATGASGPQAGIGPVGVGVTRSLAIRHRALVPAVPAPTPAPAPGRTQAPRPTPPPGPTTAPGGDGSS